MNTKNKNMNTKNKNMNTRGLCLYHANCADGFAAALCVWRKYGDSYEYVPVQYGQDPPPVKGRKVVIVDFSYPREVLLKMKERAESLLVLDHHQTAEQDLKGLPFCVFDNTKSGAMLAWEAYSVLPPPMLIRFVQDRDLWKWELDNTKAVSAGLRLLPMDFQVWNDYIEDESLIEELVREGEVVLRYQEKCVQENVRKATRTSMAGYDVPIVNCTHLISETVGELAKDEPFAVGYFDTGDKRVFNLRSDENGVDVSEIAKRFGGGGHIHAAGFTVPRPDFGHPQETGERGCEVKWINASVWADPGRIPAHVLNVDGEDYLTAVSSPNGLAEPVSPEHRKFIAEAIIEKKESGR